MPNRREFIKTTLSGLAVAGSGVPSALLARESESPLPPSKVVHVTHSKVAQPDGKVEPALVEEMVSTALTVFTGKKTLSDAWGKFAKPGDKMGLKINALGLRSVKKTPLISHYAPVTSAIVSGLKSAGLQESDLIVWDRSDEELANAGYQLQNKPGAIRVIGTEKSRGEESIGYSKESFAVGSERSRVSKIVTEECTGFINVPILKSHRLAGITCSLKSHYGTIHNPRDFHGDHGTNPGIPEINTIPVIRKKQRLVICDALQGLYKGGPWWQQGATWPCGSILVGTDPVAVDAVALGILDEKRKEKGLALAADDAKHIKLSQKLGLGNASMDRIEVIKKTLG